MAMTGGKAYLVKQEHPNYGERAWTIDLYVYVKEKSQSTVDNQTVLSLGMYVVTPGGAYTIGPWVKTADSYIGTASSGANCRIFDGAVPNFSGTRWLIENQDIVVTHDEDGTKTVDIFWKWGVNSPWGRYVNPLGSFKHTITPIPRKALITSATDFKDTDNPKITFSNPGNFPTHVWLEPNPVGDHLCERNNIPNIGEYTWELTEAERDALRNSCQGPKCPIRIGLYTDIGGTQYADYKDMTFFVSDNDKTKPSVTTDVKLDNSLIPSKFADMPIQGKSKLDVTITAQGKYGATIKSLYGLVEKKQYNSDKFKTDVLNTSGTVNVYGIAKDSRDITGGHIIPMTVAPYSKPLLVPIENSILCYRSDGNGKRVGNSTSLWVKAKMTHYPLYSVNQCAMQWRWKRSVDTWNDSEHQWNNLIPKTSESGLEYDGLIPNGVFEKKMSYTVQIRAIDDIGEYDVKSFDIPTEDVALHLGKGGKKVSVGTYNTDLDDYTFYSAWDTYFEKDVYISDNKVVDFLIERGTSGIWTYEKWASGKAVCWAKIPYNVDLADTNVRVDTTLDTPFPFTFIDIPFCNFTLTNQTIWNHSLSSCDFTNSKVSKFSVYRVGPGVNVTAGGTANIRAIGKWK